MMLKNDISQWVLAATALLSGLISGRMLAIWIANWAARELPEMSWTLRFQVENKLFTKTMPPSLMGPMVGSRHCASCRLRAAARYRRAALASPR